MAKAVFSRETPHEESIARLSGLFLVQLASILSDLQVER
jgi:hypothetical protein